LLPYDEKDEYKIRVYIVLTEFNSIQCNNIPFSCGRNSKHTHTETERDIYQTLPCSSLAMSW